MKIGVFDSGVGGKSVANAIQKALPEHEILLREDSENLPYGNKSPEVLLGLVEPILREMIASGCEVIVVACNTVTTTIIAELRKRLPVPLIGVEPMVKPAAGLTKTGVIAVCATPTTLTSQRYQQLKAGYARHIKVVEPDCSDWSYMIEHNQVEQDKIAERINAALKEQADVIVLACTHYHWIEDEINDIAQGRAIVIQPEQALIAQLKRVLEQQQ